MFQWDPDLYLKFQKERTVPALDLLSRIHMQQPKRVLDIGCGPGNSTIPYVNRWPQAEVIGIDNSKEMIASARDHFPNLNWLVLDASDDLSHLGMFDVVVSNSVLHWLPNHEELVPHLFQSVSSNGVLAVHVPSDNESPLFHAVRTTAKSKKWAGRTVTDSGAIYREPEHYSNILCRLTDEYRIWRTTYYHILNSHHAMIEWYRATGMRPFLAGLNEEEQQEFENDVLQILQTAYPCQKNGTILFPFRRLFFTAIKMV